MRRHLDRSRYFATEHGGFDNAVRYWQDGLAFDADGKLVKTRLTPKQPRRLGAAGAVASPPAALGESAATAPEAAAPAAPESPPNGEVDLERWLKGAERHVPTKVFAAVKRRYARRVTTFAEAVEFLVGEVKLVPPADVDARLRPKND
jgi:hypothetical protein